MLIVRFFYEYSRLYNESDTEYVQCANALEKYFQTKMKEIGLWDRDLSK